MSRLAAAGSPPVEAHLPLLTLPPLLFHALDIVFLDHTNPHDRCDGLDFDGLYHMHKEFIAFPLILVQRIFLPISPEPYSLF